MSHHVHCSCKLSALQDRGEPTFASCAPACVCPCNKRPMRTQEEACTFASRPSQFPLLCADLQINCMFSRARKVSYLTRLKPFSRFSALVAS